MRWPEVRIEPHGERPCVVSAPGYAEYWARIRGHSARDAALIRKNLLAGKRVVVLSRKAPRRVRFIPLRTRNGEL